MPTTFVDLDVRPILRSGGEPFGMIMETIQGLKPGEGLRLFATFKPTPLLHVLDSKGFVHEAKELEGGEWEVLFSPTGKSEAEPAVVAAPTADVSPWPAPVQHLDNRDLGPPEPMVKILEAIETMAPGEVLSALLCREPIFLFRELAKRGHSWQGGFGADGKTYKVLVRVGAAKEETAA